MSRRLSIERETFPIAGAFTIARGSRTEAVVVTATIEAQGRTGHGECVPYARYGETPQSVMDQIGEARSFIESGGDRQDLLQALPAGAARNALDCALWDLEAKLTGVPAHVLAGLARIAPATTCYTISLGPPEEMARSAYQAATRPILKIKLGGGADDPARITAVRAAAPDTTLIVDANEGWRSEDLEAQFAACAQAGVVLVEQPLPAGQDLVLGHIDLPIPVCADESAHGLESMDEVARLYDAINVKLDKSGGLTAALDIVRAADERGLRVMVGCMVGTSLAMAPAMLLTPRAQFVDLDGPLLLARDRNPALRYDGSLIYPADPRLWG